MADMNLTQAEADALLAVHKHRVNEDRSDFPMAGQSLILPLQSHDKREHFLLDLSRGSRHLRCRGLLLHRGSGSRIGDAADPLAEALQALTQSLAQLRQPLGAKQQKRNYRQDHQMPRLK